MIKSNELMSHELVALYGVALVGTGAYAGAHGELDSVRAEDGSWTHTLTFEAIDPDAPMTELAKNWQPSAVEAAIYERWLAEGRAGDMRFLLHHRKARVDPGTRYPWAKSIVSAFVPHAPPPRPPPLRRRPPRAREAQARLRGRLDIIYVMPDWFTDTARPCMDGWGRRFITVAPEQAMTAAHAAEDAVMRGDTTAHSPTSKARWLARS